MSLLPFLELVEAEQEVVLEVKPEAVTAETEFTLEAPQEITEEVTLDVPTTFDVSFDQKEEPEAEFQVSLWSTIQVKVNWF